MGGRLLLQGIFPAQGPDPHPLVLAGGFFTAEPVDGPADRMVLCALLNASWGALCLVGSGTTCRAYKDCGPVRQPGGPWNGFLGSS